MTDVHSNERVEENIEDRLRGMAYNIKHNMALSMLPVLTDAYETHPDHPLVNYLLALRHYKNNNFNKAMEFIQIAVEKDPEADDYLVLLAELYLKSNLPQDAEEQAQKAFSLNGENWEAAKILADIAF